ncbi:LysR family transcriptional regulator [Sphaerisporangium krabiense]|uniref:DNA-binding transcriptional LysR family regulator n=1 Tax=Sphaerisporangium krabiense TaxID=763782 RepID=A0A7W8Z9D8_9ACTN|nr:LysR substrate-binding domain-containing protein [Sphaerisporangium krabiense]MBB5629720.1 DNA-binding transcriptional LysR family regulator [Sphaerisporangium krabiense]
MELRQLEYAVTVAEELHFGRAAARLHVTQQSVSEQIRRLERELGAPLFTRTSRRVTVTAVGEVFLREARGAVAAVRHALDVGRRAAAGTLDDVSVGYAEDLGPRLFQLAVPALRARLPSVRLAPCPMTTPDQLAALTGRRLDVGFCWTAELPPGLDSLLVTREPLVVALSAGHPLAGSDTIDPARLSHEPLVTVERAVNPWLHDHFVGQLEARGATVTIHREISSLDRLLPLVLTGSAVGLTVVGAAAARPFAGVVYRPFSEPSPYADHSVVWRRDAAGPAVAALVDVVRELRDAGAFMPPELGRPHQEPVRGDRILGDN